MKNFIILIFIIIFPACTGPVYPRSYKPTPQAVLLRSISNKVLAYVTKEKELYPCECGGKITEKVKSVHCGFDYYKEIDIEKARELLMYVADQLLESFNTNEDIKPYLSGQPLKPENIEICIFCNNKDNSKLDPYQLQTAVYRSGVLKYRINHPENRGLKTFLEETYEEAEAKLKASAQQNLGYTQDLWKKRELVPFFPGDVI